MGGFLAAANHHFDGVIFTLCCVTTVLLQILSNLANDYGDSVNGADHAARKGPQRAVQSGAISARQMKRAVGIFVVLCLASGISLLVVAFGWDWSALLFFFALGLLAIGAAIAYTVGKRPYGYVGLGDISVLIFFGFVGVLGSLYLFTKQLNWPDVLPALSCGLFSIGVLNINNIRDIESDRLAGKFSVPVRVGKRRAAIYHWVLIVTGLLTATLYVTLYYRTPWQFLFLVTAPVFFNIAIAVGQTPSADLDPFLKQMALATLVFVLLFGTGMLVG
jgi:1,4-dihydroxy-2-naphthoate octaprenyltransferase